MKRGIVFGVGGLCVFLVGIVIGGQFAAPPIDPESSQTAISALETSLHSLRFDCNRQGYALERIEASLLDLQNEIAQVQSRPVPAKAVPSDLHLRLAQVEEALKKNTPQDEDAQKRKEEEREREKRLLIKLRDVVSRQEKEQIQRKIQYGQRAVENANGDSPVLEDLVLLYLHTNEPKKAMSFVKKYGELLPAWKRNRLYGKIFGFDGDWEQLRAFLQKTKSDPEAPEWAKLEATWDWANSFFSEGKKTDGILLLQSILDEYGDKPPIGGLEYLEKAKAKLADPNSTP